MGIKGYSIQINPKDKYAIPTISRAGQPNGLLRLRLFLIRYQPLLSQQDLVYPGQNRTTTMASPKQYATLENQDGSPHAEFSSRPKDTSFVTGPA